MEYSNLLCIIYPCWTSANFKHLSWSDYCNLLCTYVLLCTVRCNLFGMYACWTTGICLVSILDGLLEYPLCLFLLDHWNFFCMHSCLTTVTLLSILECLLEFPLCLFLLDHWELFCVYSCWTTGNYFVFILAGLL